MGGTRIALVSGTMRKVLALLLSLPLTACVVGDGSDAGDMTGGGGGDGTGGGGGDGTGGGGGMGGTGISGNITQSTDWSGSVVISGVTTINAGVTVTVAAGTTITVKGVGSLQIAGILDVQGTSAARVIIKPETQGWGGISVNAGGELKYSFVDQTGAGITTNGTGKTTIRDTRLSKAAGDFLIVNGGTLDIAYSSIGLDPGQQDTTHCQMHLNQGGNVIKVTHSNIGTASYGLMFYGGMNADFTYNNWFDNTTDVDIQQGSPVSGNFSNGWFQKTAPTGSGITANNLSATRLAACTGANDAACAGSR